MYILGISSFFHDSAAALLKDGELVAAVEQERFSRIKHDSSFPYEAIQWCLKDQGIEVKDLGAIAYFEKPYLKLDRIIRSHFRTWPKSFNSFRKSILSWSGDKVNIRGLIRSRLNYKGPVYFCEHHESHAAAAYYSSGLEEAMVLTVDGVGEWATTKVFKAENGKLKALEEVHYPDSLGFFYSGVTEYLGFDVNDGEYKVMGLAPYGKAKFLDTLHNHIVRFREDGQFSLNMDYFSFQFGERMTRHSKWEKLLGFPGRSASDPIGQNHMDLAASAQVLLEEVLLAIVNRTLGNAQNLCLGGGVALNCVANSRILSSGAVRSLWVFPAAGDAGGAVGSAYWTHYMLLNQTQKFTRLENVMLGPQYAEDEIRDYLTRSRIPFEELSEKELIERAVNAIVQQRVIGWFQGKMEFGPRALGNRSILADPRKKEIWPHINHRVKSREDFRPFAPAVAEEKASQFFHQPTKSPFMLFTAQNKTACFPAVTHVDGSSRLQTVSAKENPLFHRLLMEFGEESGAPVLLNTSFNLAGEPIVCTPQDAYSTFARGSLDDLFIERFHIKREHLPYLKRVSL